MSNAIFAGLEGRNIAVTRFEHSWNFDFGDDWKILSQGLWRLRNAQRLLLTAEDDGHQFGLPAPTDAQAEANALLNGKKVSACHVDEATGDLRVSFEHVTLEIISTSAGYESWQATLGDKLVVGRGDGLTIFDEAK